MTHLYQHYLPNNPVEPSGVAGSHHCLETKDKKKKIRKIRKYQSQIVHQNVRSTKNRSYIFGTLLSYKHQCDQEKK